MKIIGLTIGPIIKTLGMAKKTREIWTASYLFSFLMKTIIHQLKQLGLDEKNIIIPNQNPPSDPSKKLKAGFFPDRLIFRAMDGDFEKLKEAVNISMQIIANGIYEKLREENNALNIEKVRDALDSYLQIYFVEKDFDQDMNPIVELSSYLDCIERQTKFIHIDTNQVIQKFLKSKGKNFLSLDAGLDERFKSLIEIASCELEKIDKQIYYQTIKKYIINQYDEDETSIIQALKTDEAFKEEFKMYHKYIAIVQADGDDIGETIKEKKLDQLKIFTQGFTSFASDAVHIIQDYGGTPVYAGGDDLLFFAPIVNRFKNEQDSTYSQRNIFDLINEIDAKFKEKFPDNTLSYGVSITYYKFPMNEALVEARNQLENHAKKHSENGKRKNAVAFKVLKHSGRAFGTVFQKELMKDDSPGNRNIYTLVMKLLKDFSDKDKDKYLNSIVHSIQAYRGILKELFEHVPDQVEERVKHFFANSFDEEIHDEYRGYIDRVAELVYKVYIAVPDAEKKDDRKFQAVYAVLRTLHFFNQDDNERQ